jgi:Xaa-Pro aminopeptidase
MIGKTLILVLSTFVLALSAPSAMQGVPEHDVAKALNIRDRADLVLRVTRGRLDRLLAGFMRESGFDMWIIACNEDDLDPVLMTMMPYENWCPITQIIVLFDRGPDKGVERINVSRTDTQGLFENAWDAAAWDKDKKESQWDCLGRIVRERDPKRIGINTGEVQWAAGGLTSVLEARLKDAVGPLYAARLRSAEPLATLWLETLGDEELEIMERAAAISRSLIADMFSDPVVTPGHTTTDDLRFAYWQRVADLGLDVSFSPFVSIRGRAPADVERYGTADKIIRPGDIVHCDVGLKYMRWNSDHQEVAYVLKPGETDVPETFRKMMAEANRLQDVYRGEFKTGLTGNEILVNTLRKAAGLGIPGPKVYSHSLGYFLHEPGPLIGLPWEQANNPGRGDVRLVPGSCFTAEMSVTAPVPEWGGKEFRLPLEQDVAFTGREVIFLAGRQTAFHVIR